MKRARGTFTWKLLPLSLAQIRVHVCKASEEKRELSDDIQQGAKLLLQTAWQWHQ